MAAVWISCFIVLCVIVSDGAKTISGKAYYCRDPDTGKLHDVNTTWPSTTFCGSYICKIRKKNHTNTGVQPLRQLNITSSNNKLILTFNSTIESVSQAHPISDSFHVSDKHRNISKNAKEIQDLVREKMGHINEQLRQGDRYLTEDEIKAFTEILRFMKKSDLEALLEIYSLAQDIYKEIDKATDENIIEETLRDLKENNISENMGKAINKSTSYWYEPLAVMSNKHRLNENDMSKDSELMQNVLENLTKGTNNVNAIVKPKETTIRTTPLLTPKPKVEPNRSVFFKGTFSEDDFGKLPYFYPMSSFQRLSSYINPFIQTSIQSQQKAYNNVQIPQMIQVIPPWYKPYMVPYQTKPLPDMTYNQKVTEAKNVAKTQKVATPTQIHQNNVTETENSYFNAYPWSLYNLYPPIKKQIPQQLPSVNTGYLNYQPNTLLMNSEIIDQKQDKEVNAMVVPEKKLPDWQTEPLPNSVLDEVRANILMKAKLIPLRKKMRLERVGKVIKLEDIRKDRAKREAEDFDEYEAYVEKYTCGSDTEPGFFRMGNTTEAYPACCPQRIGKGS